MQKKYDLNIKQNQNEIALSKLAGSFKAKYLNTWWETDSSIRSFTRKYSKSEQQQKEKATSVFIKKISKEIETKPHTQDESKFWLKNIKNLTREFAKNVLEFTDEYLEILFADGFTKATIDFLKEVKNFDSEIKVEDIFQAIRNVWIMNSIQLFLSKEVEFTPSVFAYSMLYPYTDNYIDDDKISRQTKISFNHRFKCRLSGENIQPLNSNELAIFMLVQMIENQYPRDCFPEIYEALLGIHNAQSKSLLQQDRVSAIYETDIIGITFEKGGMSVLTDAFLVKGRLSEREAEFMFGFGIILQLADDLQDVNVDREKGHMTVFSQAAGTLYKLDNIVNKLFNFMVTVLEDDAFFSNPKLIELKKLIKFNCNFLLFQAIAKNQEFFSREFIKNIEVYSPYSFKFLRSLYNKLQKEHKKLSNKNSSFDYTSIFEASTVRTDDI